MSTTTEVEAAVAKGIAAQQAVDEIVSEITGEPTTPTVAELQAQIADLETRLVTAGRTMIEFRAQVRHEAMAMAQQHNLCTVVENTLRKVGIDVERTTVEVVTTTEQVNRFVVPNDLLARFDEQQFVAWATTRAIPRGLLARDVRGIQQVPVANRTVGEPTYRVVEQVQPRPRRGPRPTEDVVAPPGFLAAYASTDGRVLHYVNVGDANVDTHYDGRYIGVRGYALCGDGGTWRANSNRGENRVCHRCHRRAGR